MTIREFANVVDEMSVFEIKAYNDETDDITTVYCGTAINLFNVSHIDLDKEITYIYPIMDYINNIEKPVIVVEFCI